MECFICHDKDASVNTECNHNFCYQCISEWVKINPICPYCRSEIDNEKIVDININNISKRLLRSDVYELKASMLYEKITVFLEKINFLPELEDRIKTYEELNKFLYKNKYYLRNRSYTNLLTEESKTIPKFSDKFVKTMLSKGAELSRDYPELYCWYFKFREYFLIK